MTLFGPEVGGMHEGDPETSVEAATSLANRLTWGSQRYKLLLTFYGRQEGLTPDAAGELAGVEDYSQRRRCSELTKKGLVAPTGVTEKGQRVLRITASGEAALRGVRGRPPGRDYQGNQMKEVK